LRSRGIFGLGGSFTVYKVCTSIKDDKGNIKDYEVFRRFRHFRWIKNILRKCFPGRYISPLFKKINGKTNELNTEKRMHFL